MEDADFSELCGSASPHPVRCHVNLNIILNVKVPFFKAKELIMQCTLNKVFSFSFK